MSGNRKTAPESTGTCTSRYTGSQDLPVNNTKNELVFKPLFWAI